MMLRSRPTLPSAANLAAVLFFSALSFGQSKIETAPPATPVTGAITGRVLNSAGEPLPDAVVYAGSVGGPRRSQSAKADRNGDFKIVGLTAGVYRVTAGLQGYIPSTQFAFNSQNFHQIGDHVTLTMNKGGVITGKVTGPSGPLVAVGVFAFRVRDEAGKPLTTPMLLRERATDDRGIYRVYGLPPGGYVVVAAKPRTGMIAPSAYDNDMPTYFPSSTRDTAGEIIVRDGEEITADIQYRGEPGHAISGKVFGIVESQAQFLPSATITLTDVRNRTAILGTATTSNDNFSFAVYGVPDGEYEVSALQYLPSRDELRSPPRRVTVRGADVGGLTLVLASQASIEGHLVFESDPKAGCGKRRETAAQETVVYGRRYEEKKNDAAAKATPAPEVSVSASNHVSLGVGDTKGSFSLRNLPPGSYHIDPRPPANGWYVRSIAASSLHSATTKKPNTTVARDGINVKSGERVSGLTVTITEGAASLRGRVNAAEGQSLPAGIRVYLAPAEKESADNVLRFFEAPADLDGAFVIGNIAPGHYRIVARETDQRDSTIWKHIREDASRRADVLREAEKLKLEIELKPCQRMIDYAFSYQMPGGE